MIETPTANVAKVKLGSGTATMLNLLIANARFGTEVLNTRMDNRKVRHQRNSQDTVLST
ncbi:MAG: hypothetical protein ACFKPT_11570 [Gloeotrichia echinulata GP01]